jgi:CheY-like chemotaxis protein
MPQNKISKNKIILVVEDEPILLRALNIELLNAGFEALVAPNGEVGLKMIKANKPDLVLLDILMPKMDGYEVLKAAKKDPKTKKIPIVVLSNFGEAENIEKAMGMGAVDYFIKSSTDLNQLTKKINARLGTKGA